MHSYITGICERKISKRFCKEVPRPFCSLLQEHLHNKDNLTSLNQYLFSSIDNLVHWGRYHLKFSHFPNMSTPSPHCHSYQISSSSSHHHSKVFLRCWRNTAGHHLKQVCSETNTEFALHASTCQPRTFSFLILFFETSYSLAVSHCLLFSLLFFFFKGVIVYFSSDVFFCVLHHIL